MSVSWCVDPPHLLLTHNLLCIAIIVFPGRGPHSIALESHIRPYRPKTRHSQWTFGAINLDVLLWALQNFLGTGAKACSTRSVNKVPDQFMSSQFSRSLNGALSTLL